MWVMEAKTYLIGNGRRIPAHPAADCWPTGDATEIADDFRLNGQQVPVVLTADCEQVLDGRTRLRACEILGLTPRWVMAPEAADPVDIVVALNEKRRHLDDSKRAMIAARLANLKQGQKTGDSQNCETPITQPVAAAKMNVSERSVWSAAQIKDDDTLAPAVDDGTLAVSDAAAIRKETPAVKQEAVRRVKEGEAKNARKAAADVKRETRRDEARRAADANPIPPNLHVCNVATLHHKIEAGSVDAIITDPPYIVESVEAGVYRDLASFAAHALRPGGLLLTVIPHAHLQEVLVQMVHEDLRYRWTMAYLQPQGRQQIHSARVTCRWKPWGAWTRAVGQPDGYSSDVIYAGRWTSEATEDHVWGQHAGGIRSVIEEWVKEPGSLVLDPFVGAGSIVVEAARAGHRVIAADVDPACVEITRRKLEEADDEDEHGA